MLHVKNFFYLRLLWHFYPLIVHPALLFISLRNYLIFVVGPNKSVELNASSGNALTINVPAHFLIWRPLHFLRTKLTRTNNRKIEVEEVISSINFTGAEATESRSLKGLEMPRKVFDLEHR